MKVTIGGDRLGSGGKMETNLKNYGRSTHNLSKDWISSAAVGVLYPFYSNIGLNGDTFDINLEAAARTLPTQAPLFGSFKLQLDMFVCPLRLYQGILHNNPINLGLKMNQVKLPKILVPAGGYNNTSVWRYYQEEQIATNALLRYLGISGCGIINDETPHAFYRKFNATPVLAYYDIFKNYYANKQEQNAYVIGEGKTELLKQEYIQTNINLVTGTPIYYGWGESEQTHTSNIPLFVGYNATFSPTYTIKMENIDGYGYNLKNIYIRFSSLSDKRFSLEKLAKSNIIKIINIKQYNNNNGSSAGGGSDKSTRVDQVKQTWIIFQFANLLETSFWDVYNIQTHSGATFQVAYDEVLQNNTGITLKSFPLENIDKMRQIILAQNQLEDEVIIRSNGTNESVDMLPYNTLTTWQAAYVNGEIEGIPYSNNVRPMNGLVVKTYQSDMFNNWVQTEWITGENGINEISKVDVSNGLYMDALNLAQKVYDMLNRVAVSGGTYQDWQEAVYTEKAQRHAETPMWVGGYSDEVVFEEVIQTTPTEESPLGNLGGKGKLIGTKHGGHIKIKITEPSIIMGIASLTPRICYSQGNAWYMTELDSIDDLHKPALDGIGFQDLITEQMAWWDTHIHANTGAVIKRSAGKIPAWLNYMTDVNQAFGDFADAQKAGYMVLGRNYEPNMELNDDHIKDLTTYIDPSKFNYAFAYANLEAQNFWLQIRTSIKARRKMSAKIIPNL